MRTTAPGRYISESSSHPLMTARITTPHPRPQPGTVVKAATAAGSDGQQLGRGKRPVIYVNFIRPATARQVFGRRGDLRQMLPSGALEQRRIRAGAAPIFWLLPTCFPVNRMLT